MTHRKKTELQVFNITNSRIQAGAYALILSEKDGNRQLPIIIGATEAQAIIIELKGIIPPRPLTHMLFSSVLEAMGVRLLRVLIYKADNGVFYVAAPIFIYDDILETEHIRISDAEEDGGATSNATPSTDNGATREPSLASLKHALEKAVEAENYEQAAVLRDKIKQLSQTE